MQPGNHFVAAAIGIALGIVGSLPHGAHGEAPGPTTQQAVAGALRLNGVVHLDDDGKAVQPTLQDIAPAVTDTPAGEVSTTEDAELPAPQIEAAPGGGEMILLDERFRHRTSAQRKSANGDVPAEIHCDSPAASETPPHPEPDHAPVRPGQHEPVSR